MQQARKSSKGGRARKSTRVRKQDQAFYHEIGKKDRNQGTQMSQEEMLDLLE